MKTAKQEVRIDFGIEGWEMGLINTKRGQSQRDCVFQPRVSQPWVRESTP